MAASGTPNYQFSKNNGSNWTSPTLVTATSYTFTGLSASTYNVKVKDGNGCVSTATGVTITNPSAVTVSAGDDQTICRGGSAQLSASGSGGTGSLTYSWSPATGLSATNVSNPTASPTATQTYTVTAKDANNCSKSDDVVVTVNIPTITNLNATGDTVCAGGTLHLYSSATFEGDGVYNWKYPNSNNDHQGQNQTIQNAQTNSTGLYIVTVSVSQTVNNVPCSNSLSDTVSVLVNPNPVITIESSETLPLCNDGTGTYLTAYSTINGTQFTWSDQFGGDNPIHVEPPMTHTYYVSGEDANHCVGNASIKVDVNQPTSSETQWTACDSYTWNGDDYDQSGEYEFKTTNAAGCDSTAILNLTVYYSTTTDLYDTICLGEDYKDNGFNLPHTATDYPSSSGDYEYYQYLKTVHNCDSTVTLYLRVNQTYHVTARDTICEDELPYSWNGETFAKNGPLEQTAYLSTEEDGCDSIVTMILVVNATPDIVLASNYADDNVCGGNSATVSVQNPPANTTYLWNTDDTEESVTVQLDASAVTDTTLTVTATTSYEGGHTCQATESKTLTVYPSPSISIQGTLAMCSGDTVTLSVNDVANTEYVWTTQVGETTEQVGTGDELEITLTTVDAIRIQSYTVVATTSYNNGNVSCSQSSEEFQITVNPLPVVEITGEETICSGTSTELSVAGNDTYKWSTGDQNVTSVTVSAPASTETITYTYYVTATDANTCVSKDTFKVTALPTYTLDLLDTICFGTRYQEHGQDTLPVRPSGVGDDEAFVVNLTHNFHTTLNCDSIVNVALRVLPKVNIQIANKNDTVCPLVGTKVLTAPINNVVMSDHLVRWHFNGQTTEHDDVVTATHAYDTIHAQIPFNCNQDFAYSVVYQDEYCWDSVERHVVVYDQSNPVITGTLPDVVVTGCSAQDDAPTAYASAVELNNVEGITVSDNCTPLELLRLTYNDAPESSTCSLKLVRTYTVKDTCGKSASITQNITIVRPDTFTISNVTKESSVNCVAQATILALDKLPVVLDGCGTQVFAGNPDTVSTVTNNCTGDIKYTYTFKNCAGADTQWTYTYHVFLPELNLTNPSAGSATCLVDATRPKADTLTDACGRQMIPTFVDSTAHVETNGTGWVKFRYAYEDCAGHKDTLEYVYNLTPGTFTPKKNDTINVHCIAQITNPKSNISITNCGEPVTLIDGINTSTLDNGCGDSTFVYNYTVNGVQYTYSYTYQVEPLDFQISVPDGRDTVACYGEVKEPTLPSITDACGRQLQPTGPSITTTGNPECEGTVVYKYTYEDCAGNKKDWFYTYVIELPALKIPADGADVVTCENAAVAPTLITVKDSCQRSISPVLNANNPVTVMNNNGHGTVTYNYTYTDCANRNYAWKFVYTITPEGFTPVADGDSTIKCVSNYFVPDTPNVVICGAKVKFTRDSIVNHTNGCGERIYYYHYTVNDTLYHWKYAIHVAPDDFVKTVAKDSTVNCVAQAKANAITLPTVVDACGNTLSPGTLTIDSSSYKLTGCQGDLVFKYPYEDCAGHKDTFKFTYHIVLPNKIDPFPADDGISVPCLVDVKQPTLPIVKDVCNNILTPTYNPAVDSIADVDLVSGTGTVTFRYHYQDCAGHDTVWTYVDTLDPDAFSPSPNDTADVSCISEIGEPVTPVRTNCGVAVPFSLVGKTSTLSNGCGDSTFVYSYTVNGTDYEWKYTYRVTPEPFVLPADSVARVQCIAEVKRPVPPTVTGCAEIIPTMVVQDSTTHGCADTVIYAFTYQDCVPAHTKTWTCTFYVKDTIKPSYMTSDDQVLCRDLNNECVTDTNTLGGVVNLSDNCTATNDLVVTYSDWTTNHITSQDTLIRTWTVSDGCNDSVHVQTILINPSYHVVLHKSICYGTSFTFGGKTVSTPDTYYDTTHSVVTGCDSVTILHLSIDDVIRDTLYVTICHGNTYDDFNGEDLSVSGEYKDTTQTAAGCDSITVLYLTVNDYIRKTINKTICSGSSFHFKGQDLSVSGTYMDTTKTAQGCDSITTLNLTVDDVIVVTLNESICQGQTRFFKGGFRTTTGEYKDTTKTDQGCDSVTILNLTVNPIAYGDIYETACDSFKWYDSTYKETPTSTPTHTFAGGSQFGCDSIVRLHLTINKPTYGDTTAVACESFTWHGITYTESGEYTPNPTYWTNSNGCDSIVKLNLTINKPQHSAVTEIACDSLRWNNTLYTASGDYTYPHEDANGCLQVDTLHLTINHSTDSTITVVSYEPYTWHDSTYTVTPSTDPVYVTQNAVGCDSVVTLKLTLFLKSYGEITVVECDSFAWHDSTYYMTPATDPTYTMVGANQFGGDSVVTLHLTINYSSTGNDTVVACDSYTWIDGVTYYETPTTPPTYTLQGANSSHCDSVVTLYLTVYDSHDHKDTVSSCISYTWDRDGVTYTQSGDYGFEHEINGCPHIDSLHLTIYQPDTTSFEAWTCNYYIWNNKTYDTEGEYTDTLQNVHGCDSIVTMKLTISDSYEYIYHDSIEWYGNESQFWYVFTPNDSVFIEHPGKYTDTLTSATGCDSVVSVIIIAKNLCDIQVSAQVTSEVCGGDGKIIVLATPDPTRLEPVVYSIDGDVFYDNNIFENLSAGFYPIVARQGGCFRVIYGIVDPSNGLVMTCPPAVTENLNSGEQVLKFDPNIFGQPNLTMTRGTIPITPTMPADSLIIRGVFPYDTVSEWPYSFTTDMPADSSFAPGEHVLTWTLNDSVCGIQKTCEQIVVVNYQECPPAIDCENHVYPSVRIDNYCWTTINLRSGYYQNPDSTCSDTIPCIYEYTSTLHPNTAANVDAFGRLYCFEAAIGDSTINSNGHIQGICPTGWYLPSPEQYLQLNAHGAFALKTPNYWLDGGGDNSTGFSWLPAGYWNGAAQRFEGMLSSGYFWATKVVNGQIQSSTIFIDHDCDTVKVTDSHEGMGYSIRCIKEE